MHQGQVASKAAVIFLLSSHNSMGYPGEVQSHWSWRWVAPKSEGTTFKEKKVLSFLFFSLLSLF